MQPEVLEYLPSLGLSRLKNSLKPSMIKTEYSASLIVGYVFEIFGLSWQKIE